MASHFYHIDAVMSFWTIQARGIGSTGAGSACERFLAYFDCLKIGPSHECAEARPSQVRTNCMCEQASQASDHQVKSSFGSLKKKNECCAAAAAWPPPHHACCAAAWPPPHRGWCVAVWPPPRVARCAAAMPPSPRPPPGQTADAHVTVLKCDRDACPSSGLKHQAVELRCRAPLHAAPSDFRTFVVSIAQYLSPLTCAQQQSLSSAFVAFGHVPGRPEGARPERHRWRPCTRPPDHPPPCEVVGGSPGPPWPPRPPAWVGSGG